jgi:hypothetical protein
VSLAENIASVQSRIARAAERAGRSPADIRLIAVTKTHPPDLIAAAARLGLADFGENRIEEAAPKIAALSNAALSNAALSRAAIRWHMIGHVQSRKAREVVQAGFVLVHSVDSLKLAQRLSRYAVEANRTQPILLECNVSGEAAKSGFAAADLSRWPAVLDEFSKILALPGVQVRGLMTMAPLGTDQDTARPTFQRLRELREAARAQLPHGDWAELSMGMTDDFEGAIAEGATLVRVGRAIFGERL